MYPAKDKDFEEVTIVEVSGNGKGWTVKRDDGMSFFVPPESPIEPTKGMSARMYGKGLGSPIRGLFLNGHKVYYRNKEEQEKYMDIELYGKDAQDWLDRWDSGKSVWSISMGGLGPGYEQAIQITVAELLRFILEKGYDKTAMMDEIKWKPIADEIHNHSCNNTVIKKVGLSGAQYGAALNVSTMLYLKGPIQIMNDDRVKDRHIQVSKSFPKG